MLNGKLGGSLDTASSSPCKMKKTSSLLHAVFMFIWYTLIGNAEKVRLRLTMLIQKLNLVFASIALFSALSACVNISPQEVKVAPQGWQEEFNIPGRKLADTGESKYFILTPGYQTVLASGNATLTITVLDETKEINGISTRVVEEREEIDGELYEVARNFFAIDQESGDVFYFGEEVDFYKAGVVVGHSGAWLAYENGSKPGLIMPGTPEVGMRYYQELAPGVALDRAKVITISETFKTPAGEFENCLVTEESSALEPAKERKTYAPGIGLVQDQSLLLVSYGYIEQASPQK